MNRFQYPEQPSIDIWRCKSEKIYALTRDLGLLCQEELLGRDINVDITWLEGVYTFKREVHLSIKLPYVEHQRTVMHDGTAIRQSDSGLGDIVVGVPLKHYTNEAAATSNIAFTPSIRLPTGSTARDFPIGDGSADLGVSFSASFEEASMYQYYDLFYWQNGKGKRGIRAGNELGLDMNIGWHPYHDNLNNEGVFLMIDVSLAPKSQEAIPLTWVLASCFNLRCGCQMQ